MICDTLYRIPRELSELFGTPPNSTHHVFYFALLLVATTKGFRQAKNRMWEHVASCTPNPQITKKTTLAQSLKFWGYSVLK